jgi:arsenite methyltransferase
MKSLHVFDPTMCCSTGVCGPEVDPVLPRFAADLAWLASSGVEVVRHNLAQEPAAFVAEPAVAALLKEEGDGCLPVIVVDGAVVSQGSYPERGRLAAWVGLEGAPPPLFEIRPAQEEGGACC